MRLRINPINYAGYVLQPKEDIVFEYWYNNDLNCLETDLGEFNLFVFGGSHYELQESIKEVLIFLWSYFALEDDENLTEGAKNIKYLMLEKFSVKGVGE